MKIIGYVKDPKYGILPLYEFSETLECIQVSAEDEETATTGE